MEAEEIFGVAFNAADFGLGSDDDEEEEEPEKEDDGEEVPLITAITYNVTLPQTDPEAEDSYARHSRSFNDFG